MPLQKNIYIYIFLGGISRSSIAKNKFYKFAINKKRDHKNAKKVEQVRDNISKYITSIRNTI